MVRGRTTAPNGIVLGHEITGEVIEGGTDVEFIKAVTFARCRSTSRAVAVATAKQRHTGICLNDEP